MTSDLIADAQPPDRGDDTVVSVEPIVVDLPAKRQMVLAGGGARSDESTTPRVLTKVTSSSGVVGWGESRGNHLWNEETISSVHATIRDHLGPAVIGARAWDLDDLHRRMDGAVRSGHSMSHPNARAAIDVAVHDLIGKIRGVPVSFLLGGQRLDEIELAWIVASSDPSDGRRQAMEGLDLGYTAFKVKVGMHGVSGDMAFVRDVRSAVGDRAAVWVDANQGYTLRDAREVARQLPDAGVDLLEQPIPAGNIAGLRRLIAESPTTIALDESLRSPADLLEIMRGASVEAVVAKVQRSGGLWYSRQLGEIAEAADMRLLGSGLSETDIGLAAGLHLFARFGITRYADLNGRQFLESPFASDSMDLVGGRIKVPQSSGLGVDVDEDRVRAYARSPAA